MEIWEQLDKVMDWEGLKKDTEEAAKNGGSGYREVPDGEYEVKVNKIEMKISKAGNPMVTTSFKIVNGEYKNSLVFYNQVFTAGYQTHLLNEFLRSLDSGVTIDWIRPKELNDIILDIMENIVDKLEYVLEIGDNKGYKTFKIKDVFVLE